MWMVMLLPSKVQRSYLGPQQLTETAAPRHTNMGLPVRSHAAPAAPAFQGQFLDPRSQRISVGNAPCCSPIHPPSNGDLVPVSLTSGLLPLTNSVQCLLEFLLE